MKVETLGHLVTWSGAVHRELAKRLSTAAERTEDGPSKWFIEYAAKHEAKMAEEIAGLERSIDAKGRDTWLYDWLDHPPQPPERITGDTTGDLSFNAISRAVFEVHNQIMSMFKQLLPRADIPEAKELIENVIGLEEGHTRQMAQQMNRIRDM